MGAARNIVINTLEGATHKILRHRRDIYFLSVIMSIYIYLFFLLLWLNELPNFLIEDKVWGGLNVEDGGEEGRRE